MSTLSELEKTWATTDRTDLMLEYLESIQPVHKFRLLCVSVCREWWFKYPEEVTRAIMVAEKRAEMRRREEDDVNELEAVVDSFNHLVKAQGWDLFDIAREACDPRLQDSRSDIHWVSNERHAGFPRARLAELVRSHFGNPFDAFTLKVRKGDPLTLGRDGVMRKHVSGMSINAIADKDETEGKRTWVQPIEVRDKKAHWPIGSHPWITPTVGQLVKLAYAERDRRKCFKCKGLGEITWGSDDGGSPAMACGRCHGNGQHYASFDPTTLLAIADALEEAGCPSVKCPDCENGEIRVNQPWGSVDIVRCLKCKMTGWLPHPLTSHLRSEGPHYLGMWSMEELKYEVDRVKWTA